MKIFIGVSFVALILVACFIGFKVFGVGNGGGDGNQISSAFAEEKNDKEPQDQENKEVIIKVEESKIFVGEEECEGIEDLTDRISKISSQGNSTEYVFEHEYAIKATYDEVKQVLKNLEETLGISIDYRE